MSENQPYLLSTLLSRSIIGKAATEAANIAKFPAETAHLMALCSASWAVGMNYNVSFFDGGAIPVNLFYMAEARSGEGKSRVMKMLTKGFASAIESESKSRKKKRQSLYDEFSQNNNGKTCNASPTETAYLNDELLKCHDMGHTVTDMTGAAFDILLSEQQGWFVLKTTEQGLIDSLFLGTITDGNVNIDPFLNAFDGEYMETRRAGRKGFSGIPHGGVGVVSQTGLIEKMLDVSGNRGLTQRFLMMLEPTMMGRRTFGRNDIDHNNLDRFNIICGGIVRSAIKNVGVLSFNNLTTLKIDCSGWDIIYDFKNKIEPSLGPGGRYEPAILSSMWSKIEIFVMKIAATLFIINGNEPTKLIDDETVVDALSIANVLLTGVSDIAAAKGIVGGVVEERVVLEYLESKSKLRGVDAMSIKNTLSRRKIFSEYQDNKSKRVMEVVEKLANDGRVSRQNIDGNFYYKFVKY